MKSTDLEYIIIYTLIVENNFFNVYRQLKEHLFEK